ncbi:MAG: hypothetical protein RIC19_03380 [Phaeodactylibacter sp.]|uniref:hypothetical protein n=1 Tax=Phaeodactylibacter sp. TaxID=1940289 RepID=UPI0032ED90FD
MKIKHLQALVNQAYIRRIKIEAELLSGRYPKEKSHELLIEYANFQLVEIELRKLLNEVTKLVEKAKQFLTSNPDVDADNTLAKEIREEIAHSYKGLPLGISERAIKFTKSYHIRQKEEREVMKKLVQSNKNPIIGKYKIDEDIEVQGTKEDFMAISELFELEDLKISECLNNYKEEVQKLINLENTNRGILIILETFK